MSGCCVRLQVAGQQGAYVARMINRGYTMGVGGMDQAPPVKVAPSAQGKVRGCEVQRPCTDGTSMWQTAQGKQLNYVWFHWGSGGGCCAHGPTAQPVSATPAIAHVHTP